MLLGGDERRAPDQDGKEPLGEGPRPSRTRRDRHPAAENLREVLRLPPPAFGSRCLSPVSSRRRKWTAATPAAEAQRRRRSPRSPSRAPTRQCAVERPTEECEPDHDQDSELDDALEYVTATAITAKEHADPCTPQPPGPWRAADHGVDGDQRQPAQDAPTRSPLAWSPGHGPKLCVARRYLCSRMKPDYTVSGKDNTVVTRRYCSR